MTRPRATARRILLAAILVIGTWLAAAGSSLAAGPRVVVLPTTGIVDSGMATYILDGIDRAEQSGAAAVVIELDTPGGSLGSMQDIVSGIFESTVPVIVWVAPAGGYAASAGTFITLASNIALMAPGTRIGAASPVGSNGEDITGTEGQKVLNDAIAYIRSIAQHRGRPVDWAVSTVRDAASYPANDAIAAGAVDGPAVTLQDVLSFATGRTVTTAAGDVTLDLAGATTDEQPMSPFLSLIRLLSDPNIAFLLLSIGSAGLLAEVWSPNFVTGIIGALALILAFIGLGALPLNVGGLLLIGLAMVLFGLEITVTSHGLLAVGGIVCLALGASALFATPTNPFEPVVRVATPVIVTVTITAAAFAALIAWAAIRSRRIVAAPGTVGGGSVVGLTGDVRAPLAPVGSVYVGGEEWSVRTASSAALPRGTIVRVVGIDGLTLIVEPDAS